MPRDPLTVNWLKLGYYDERNGGIACSGLLDQTPIERRRAGSEDNPDPSTFTQIRNRWHGGLLPA